MVRLAVTTPIRRIVIPEGKHPVKIKWTDQMRIEPCLPELEAICRQLWVYLGHVGKIVPWMDSGNHKVILAKNRDKVENFFWYMERIDVDWRSYCYLSVPLMSYTAWERMLLLLNNKQHWYWIKKLRTYAGSSEAVDYLADFLLVFMQRQIDTYSLARINTKAAIQPDEGHSVTRGKTFRSQHYALYHKLIDRIKALKVQGVDPMVWLDAKFEKASEVVDFVYLATLVNENGFDPDIAALKQQEADPWRSIRSFLGLSKDCVFPDGCIPKGWLPSQEDYRETRDIRRVTKDGFYFYANGEQRKGKYHYARNKYHTIMCVPDNFEAFKPTWKDARYLTKTPTWQEYSQWALYPGVWNEQGESQNPRIPGIKWGRG